MRRIAYKKYLLMAVALFALLSLPAECVMGLRRAAVQIVSLIFRGGALFAKTQINEQERLEAENHLLRIEVGKLRALLEQRSKIEALQEETRRYALPVRRLEETKYLSRLGAKAIAARVIYRESASWSSSFWVNVGEETNRLLGSTSIQKNSPVLVGRSVVGAIDYVGKKQSRVRLITDAALKPSVRAVRGLNQNIALLEHIEPIVRQLNGRSDLLLSAEEKSVLIKHLEKLKEQLSADREGWYLAKGILQGGKTPQYRSISLLLSGIGFNYDFADEEGPARELATGKPIDATEVTLPIIQLHDLLVTTGMDGIFPPGLRVAEVTKVYPLREGAYTYEIEASPVVGNLDTLQTVFIIPPLGYEHEDRQS